MKKARKKEYIAEVDENDRVIRKVEKHYAVKRNLWCRISAILIKNGKNEILLQQRSKLVTDPLLWATSAGGFVAYGETYLHAAKRELAEEIGINVRLKKLFKYRAPYKNRHLVVFMGTYEGPFRPNREVKQVKFFPLAEIRSMIKKMPGKLKSSIPLIFTKYYDVIKNA
jgi:NADH pyrophosphatase NudC (nudix superfamily)